MRAQSETQLQERFREVYDATFTDALRFAARRIQPADAEDVTAEAFTVVWRRITECPRDLSDARTRLRAHLEGDGRLGAGGGGVSAATVRSRPADGGASPPGSDARRDRRQSPASPPDSASAITTRPSLLMKHPN